MPDHAPEAKLAAIERLGGRVLEMPYEDWWGVIVTGMVVARAIGEHTVGTQGTPVPVLAKLVAQRGLPKLWQARARLVELFDAERGP